MNKIGMMDSGVGGLTVLQALRRRLPDVDIVYIGDTLRNPYGGLSRETICKYATELGRWLCDQGVTGIVLACNTITFTAWEALAATLPVPLWGMDPRCRFPEEVTEVAVFATPATIATHIHRKTLAKTAPHVRVREVPCDGLAAAIEIGDDAAARRWITTYTQNLPATGVGIWACTHYPIMASAWKAALPAWRWHDPGTATAEQVAAAVTPTGNGTTAVYFTGKHLPIDLLQRLLGTNYRAENQTIS